VDEKTFWASAKVNPGRITDGIPCLEWQRATNPQTEYGELSWKGKHTRAHCVSFKLTYGSIPEGKQVLHKCDNKKCIEPQHLYAGTQRQNTLDIYARNSTVKARRSMIGIRKKIKRIVFLVNRVLSEKYVLPYSKQRQWQIRMEAAGKCIKCGKAVSDRNKKYCERHRQMDCQRKNQKYLESKSA
jgi:hypothetical protein